MSLLTDLVSLWSLDEASGDALDSHGTNTLDDTTAPSRGAGKLNGYAYFTRSSSQFFGRTGASDRSTLDGGDTDFSIAGWFFLNSKPDYLFAVSRWVTGDLQYALYYDSATDRMAFTVGNSSGVTGQVDWSASPATATWMHVACGHDSVNNEIWISVNGASPVTLAWATGVKSGTTSGFYLGINENNATPFYHCWDGGMDEVGFWRRKLTQDDCKKLYNSGLALHYSRFGDPATGGLLTSLSSHWKLDETSGNRFDAHGTVDLLDLNTVSSTVNAKLGRTADFIAANSEGLFASDQAALQVGDIDATWSAWVMLDITGADRVIFAKVNNSGTLEYMLRFQSSSGKFQWFVRSVGGTQTSVTSTAALATGTWYHLIAEHNAATDQISISVNGTLDTASHAGGVGTTTLGAFALGREGDRALDYWDGRIDEVSFWKRLLTAAEKLLLYNDGLGLHYERFASPPAQTGLRKQLACYYKLDESSGSALDAHAYVNLPAFNSPLFTTGRVNTAREFFASSSQFFGIGSLPEASPGDTDFTIQAWVKLASLPGSGQVFAIVSKWSAVAALKEYVLYAYNNGTTTRFWLSVWNSADTAGADVEATNYGAIPTGTWVYVQTWHDSVNNLIGISVNNGTPNTVAHSGGVYQYGGADFMIGRYSGGSHFDGAIDEVGLWKRLLTTDEKAALYNAGAGLAYPFQVGLYGAQSVFPRQAVRRAAAF